MNIADMALPRSADRRYRLYPCPDDAADRARMSVTTTADEVLDDAKEHIEQAFRGLSKIVVERCGGHDEFNDEYRAKIREVFLDLIDMRDKLA